MYSKKLILSIFIFLSFSYYSTVMAQHTPEYIKGMIEISCQYELIDLPAGTIGIVFDYSRVDNNPKGITNAKDIIKSFSTSDNKCLQASESLLNSLKITDSKLLDLFLKYHVDSLKKSIPSAVKYDTLGVNKSGKVVPLHDLSQFYVIYFSRTQDVGKVADDFKKIKKIKAATPSPVFHNLEEPNELLYGVGDL